jgi:hypothetical protein
MIVQVFDPPMCCSTGVCGPSVDPELVQFAADLEWLRSNGVEVVRYNLSQQPSAFVGTPAVKAALARTGNSCLPLTLVDGAVKCEGRYPSRAMLAAFVGLGPAEAAPANDGSSCCCSPAPAVAFVGRKAGKGSSCC